MRSPSWEVFGVTRYDAHTHTDANKLNNQWSAERSGRLQTLANVQAGERTPEPTSMRQLFTLNICRSCNSCVVARWMVIIYWPGGPARMPGRHLGADPIYRTLSRLVGWDTKHPTSADAIYLVCARELELDELDFFMNTTSYLDLIQKPERTSGEWYYFYYYYYYFN